MKKISRIIEVLTKEGLQTFCYLVKINLKVKQSSHKKYKYWRKIHEKPLARSLPENQQPFISILFIGTGEENAGMDSLPQQNYARWEVVTISEKDSLEHCLKQTKGEYVGILRFGDKLSKDCLQKAAMEIVSAYNKGVELFYTDEDTITQNHVRQNPFFKPEYSPDTLRSFFYMGGFLLLKRELLMKLQYSLKRPIQYGGYLLALEASFLLKKNQICHIAGVCYHRQEHTSKTDLNALGEDKQKLFRHYGIEVITEEIEDCKEVRVVYQLPQKPKVSIIIPSKDNPLMLQTCLDSICQYTRYDNYEIIIVDNGSNPENKLQYEALCQNQKVSCQYHYRPMQFNFSQMCNIGAEMASGDYYLFLNDDIEITVASKEGADWLERMLGQAMQPHTGAVGVKLLYPQTNLIQHIGVVNYESGAAHLLSKAEDDKPLLFGRNRMDYNYSIVTGACLMVQKEKFRQVGGFLEELAVTFNDAELCFRLLKAGYYNVVRNDVALYHHESITRGEDALDAAKLRRNLKEMEKVFELHPDLVKRDIFYSQHLTQKELDGEVNVEVRRQNFKTIHKTRQFKGQEQCPSVVCRIESAEVERQVCIRGFAYLQNCRHNNWNRTQIVLKGREETIYASTQKIYNPTIAPQMESQKNLNFVEFYTCFPEERLKEEVYQIGVHILPFARRKEYLYMTETYLKKCKKVWHFDEFMLQ